MGFVKLNNSSVTGSLQTAARVQGSYNGQVTNRLHLTGNWDGSGIGTIDGPQGLLKDLLAAGVVTDQGGAIIVQPNNRITVSKMGQGQGNVRWTAAVVGNAPQTAQNGVQQHAAPKGQVAQPTPAEHPGITFSRLCETMKACVREAKAAWLAKDESVPPVTANIDAISATAHTLFIAADKRNCLSAASAEAKAKFAPKQPMMTADQQKEIDRLATELDANEAALLAAIGAKPPVTALTQEQANAAIRWLMNEQAKAAMNDPPPPPTPPAYEDGVPF